MTSVTLPDPDGAGVGHPLASPVWSYTYDSTTGLLASYTDPNENEFGITYDFARKIHRMQHPDGDGHTINVLDDSVMVNLGDTGYDASHLAPLNTVADMIETDIDPDGNATTLSRDRFGNVMTSTDALGNTTTYIRDTDGLTYYVITPDPNNAGGLLYTYVGYDAQGNLSYSEPPIGYEQFDYDPQFSQLTTYTDQNYNTTYYDIDPDNGDILSVRQVLGDDDEDPYRPSDDPDDPTTSYTYTDATDHAATGVPMGLVKTVVDPNGNETDYQYDPDHHWQVEQIIYAVGTADEVTYRYGYDSRDRLISVTDPLENVTTYTYDNLDRLTSETDPDPDGAGPLASPVSLYQYDANGNVTYVTDPNENTTQYTYDDHYRLHEIIQPDPDGNGNPTTTYDYDPAGNLTSMTDPMGRVTDYEYDPLNRVTSVTTHPTLSTSSTTTYAYNALGWTTSVTDPLGNPTLYQYDADGRTTKQIQLGAAGLDGQYYGDTDHERHDSEVDFPAASNQLGYSDLGGYFNAQWQGYIYIDPSQAGSTTF